MNHSYISMLEDIKNASFKGVKYYLTANDIETLRSWYGHFSDFNSIDDNELIDLLYELYIVEDVDYRPMDDYIQFVSLLAREFHFRYSDFPKMYQQYRTMIFGK